MHVSGAVRERAKAITKRLPEKGKMIEVGTLYGHLSWAVFDARPDVTITMVDNWLPMDQQPDAYIKTKDDHALHSADRAQRNETKARAVAARIAAMVLKGNSTEVAAARDPQSVDLVFIDADHSYEGCKADIAAWLPAVKKGGWLGGHDYRNPDPRFGGVDKAVDEAFTQAQIQTGENFTWWVQI